MTSGFSAILEQVVVALPGALGAIFLDWEGEAVDEFSHLKGDELRVLGAHWAIAYFHTRDAFARSELGTPRELTLRFSRQQIIMRWVTDDYLVLLALEETVNLGQASHLLREAAVQLRGQM